MPTAEEIQAYLKNLYRALGAGQLTVTIGEQTVTYRSVSDLKRAIDVFRGMLAELVNGTPSSGHAEQAVAGRRTL